MLIDVRTIPSGHSTREWKATEFAGDSEWPRLADGLTCRCEIERTQYEITIRVRFHGTAVLSCARCLCEFRLPIEGTCAVLVHQAETPDEVGYRDDDTQEFCYDDQHTQVDLSQAVFDELMTGLPMKPLCGPECPGVDRRSPGRDEQQGERPVDPRWEALRRLRQRSAPRQ
jgi:uncharacterized protein